MGGLLVHFDYLLAQLARVKDTPAGREPWSSMRCIAVPVHPTFLISLSREPPSSLRARPKKLSHTQMRTNPRAACRKWYPKSVRKGLPMRSVPCPAAPPPLFPTDQSSP